MRILPSRRFLLFILESLTVLSNTITEGFVRVTNYCPDNLSSFGEILILSDMNISPYALCRDVEYKFVRICTGVYRLRFHHFGDPNVNCISTLVPKEDYYTVRVNIPVDKLVTLNMESEIVRCKIENPPLPLKLKLTNSKDLIFHSNQSTLEANKTDWNDLLQSDPVMDSNEDESIEIHVQVHQVDDSTNSTKIQIYTLMNNPPVGILGVSPIKCDISYNSEVKVLIDNGCSTGSILPVNTGFKVEGIVSWSPAFWFQIPNRDPIFVSCSFGICKNKCNGSSCWDHTIEFTEIYNASTKVYLPSHDVYQEYMPNWKNDGLGVNRESHPPLQNDPVDKDNGHMTTQPPKSNTVTLNIPLIISLSILLPIISLLLIAVCWYKSKVNSGAYRVRNRTDL